MKEQALQCRDPRNTSFPSVSSKSCPSPNTRHTRGRVAAVFARAKVESPTGPNAHRLHLMAEGTSLNCLRRRQRGADRDGSPNIKNILRWGRVGFSHFLPASSKAAEVLQPEIGKPWVKTCPLQTNEKRNSLYQRRGHTCFCSFPTSDKAALTLSSGTGT